MRFDGILTSWNEATGSGVITPGKGGGGIAAHAVEFPQDGKRPAIGEALSFGVELGPDGTRLAHSIARPRASSRLAARHEQAWLSSSLITGALVILTASAALYYASMRHDGGHALPVAALEAGQAAERAHEHRSDPVAASRFARSASAPAKPGLRPGP